MASTADNAVLKASEKLLEWTKHASQQSLLRPYQARVIEGLIRAQHHKVLALAGMIAQGQDQAVASALKMAATDELQRLWTSLFDDCSTGDAKKLSRAERQALGVNKASFTYGEVSFGTLATILWGPHMRLRPGGVFYDLGSGTGRGVFAAAFLHDFDRCIGIEILDGLAGLSKAVLQRYQTQFKNAMPGAQFDSKETKSQGHPTSIEVAAGDFLRIDWSDADVIYINSTCFDDALMDAIAERGSRLKDGAVVITTTKPFTSPHFHLFKSKKFKMSWGQATIHLQEKITPLQASSDVALPMETASPELVPKPD